MFPNSDEKLVELPFDEIRVRQAIAEKQCELKALRSIERALKTYRIETRDGLRMQQIVSLKLANT